MLIATHEQLRVKIFKWQFKFYKLSDGLGEFSNQDKGFQCRYLRLILSFTHIISIDLRN